MAWDKIFPQSSQTISGSPPQFQANWDYIETTMKVDHIFADSTPANDGRHNVIQMPAQAVNPTLGSNMRVALYCAPSNGQDILRIRNSGAVYVLPYSERGSVAIASGTGVVNLVDFTGKPPVFGHFMMYDLQVVDRGILGLFTWDGTTVNVQVTYSGRSATAGNSSSWIRLIGAGTILQLDRDHTNNRTGKWQYVGTPYQT